MIVIKLFISLFLLFSANSMAAVKVDLSEHGPELMKAPFAARYHFYNRYHKDWIYSTYAERKDFLTDWHMRILMQENKEKEIAKKAQLEKEKIEKQKREEKRKQQEKLKALEKEKTDAHLEFVAQGKEFNHNIKENQRSIKEMQRISKQRH